MAHNLFFKKKSLRRETKATAKYSSYGTEKLIELCTYHAALPDKDDLNKLLFISDRAPVLNQRDDFIQVYLGESMNLGVMDRNLGYFQVLHHQKVYPSMGMTQKASAWSSLLNK